MKIVRQMKWKFRIYNPFLYFRHFLYYLIVFHSVEIFRQNWHKMKNSSNQIIIMRASYYFLYSGRQFLLCRIKPCCWKNHSILIQIISFLNNFEHFIATYYKFFVQLLNDNWRENDLWKFLLYLVLKPWIWLFVSVRIGMYNKFKNIKHCNVMILYFSE